MKRFIISISMLLLATLPTAVPAFADGMFLSQTNAHLYGPEQKAAISWDGRTEEMILASAVRSDNVDNFVWIVPVQSSLNPVVEASDPSVFSDLVEYFKDMKPQGRDAPFGKSLQQDVAGVQVVEIKQIDVYDIAILKAENGQDLVHWLNANGFPVDNEASALFDKYARYGDMYFVANKIALRNKYPEELQIAGSVIAEVKTKTQELEKSRDREIGDIRDVLGGKCPLPSSTVDRSTYQKQLCQCAFEKIVRDLESQGKSVSVLPADDRYPNQKVIAFDGWQVNLVNLDSFEGVYSYLTYHGRSVSENHFRSNGPWQVTKANVPNESVREEALRYGEIISKTFGGLLDHTRKLESIEEETRRAAYEFAEVQRSPYKTICYGEPPLDLKSSAWSDGIADRREKGEFKDFCHTIETLREGMATPLKFMFQPDFPYYPLEISRLSDGWGMVDVYVLAGKPVEDLNQVITRPEFKRVDESLRAKLAGKIAIGNAAYVTRLTWQGEMKNLFSDVRFGEK